MNHFGLPSGPSGIAGVLAGIISTSVAITVATDSYIHWLFVLAGIAMGLWTARMVDK